MILKNYKTIFVCYYKSPSWGNNVCTRMILFRFKNFSLAAPYHCQDSTHISQHSALSRWHQIRYPPLDAKTATVLQWLCPSSGNSEYNKTHRLGNCICFRPQVRRGGRHTLLGPLDRVNLNHWILSLLTWGRKQVQFLKRCVFLYLEFPDDE
jgi:hypothetical protein